LPGGVLVGTVAEPPSLLLAAAEDTGIDAGRTLREVVTKFGGRGGGSPRVAQGTVPDKGRLAEAVASIIVAGDR
jgi:alanyl-tRNA synthetase